MSFSGEQKNEIILQTPKSVCCRRAFLQGVLAARAADNCGEITLSVEKIEYANYISELVKEIYSKDSRVYSSQNGGRRKLLSFSSAAASKYLTSYNSGELVLTAKCSQCKSAFFRGLFFAAGRISDPLKQYSLEFSSPNSAERLKEVFESYGFEPRISEKPHEKVIYFKNSTQIEDFFAIAAMNSTTFTLIDAKIKRELRNNANRVANCETNNISKAVSTSINQIELIRELMRRGLMSYLPEELEMTARMRLEHTDLSLSSLAALITPPISKPGLSHRLKRISELAEELLSGKYGKK